MITTSPPRGVERMSQQIDHGDPVDSSDPRRDLSGRVDAILDQSADRSRYGDDRDPRRPRCQLFRDQVGIPRQTTVFQSVNQTRSRATVLVGCDKPEATGKDPLRRPAEPQPTVLTERPWTLGETCLTDHEPEGIAGQGQLTGFEF